MLLGSCLSSITLSNLLSVKGRYSKKGSFIHLRSDVVDGLLDNETEIGCTSSEVESIVNYLQTMLANDN